MSLSQVKKSDGALIESQGGRIELKLYYRRGYAGVCGVTGSPY
jgi:hypothetical protein